MLSLDRQNELREEYRQANPNWQPATELFASWVRKWLKPDSLILDLGCGRGGLVEQLDHPLQRYTGIDPDWRSLADHRLLNNQPPPNLVCAVGQCLPFSSAIFDLIFASWLLEHLPEPAKDLAEITRVLKPGGVFVFITPNKRHPLAILNHTFGHFGYLQRKMVEKVYARSGDDTFPTYYRANSEVDLARLVQKNYLEWIDLQIVADPTYLAFSGILFRLSAWLVKWLPDNRHIHLVGALRKRPIPGDGTR